MTQDCDFCETVRVAEKIEKMLEALPDIGEPFYDDPVVDAMEAVQHIIDIFKHEHERVVT